MGRPARKIRTPLSWASLIVILVGGCSGGRETTSPPPPPPKLSYQAYEADFVPADHDPLPVTIAHKADTAGTTIAGSHLSVTGAGSATSMELVPGFRVQVFSSLNIDLARAKKAELEALLPEDWFYLEYDPPAYKIRGGNFTTRLDADRYAQSLGERGYPDSWPVPTRVYKSPPRRVPPPPVVPPPDH